MLDQYAGTLGGVIPLPEATDYREIMERMRRYLEWIRDRLRRGYVPGQKTLGDLDDLVNGGLREPFEDLLTGEKTPTKIGELGRAIEKHIVETQTIAQEMGYTEAAAGAINWDRLKEGWKGLATVFPFCIPFDVVRMGGTFMADGVRPEPFTVNIVPFIPGDAGEVTLDLFSKDFDGIVRLIRIFLLLLFSVGLAMATGKVIKW